jgi:hypothetical protein
MQICISVMGDGVATAKLRARPISAYVTRPWTAGFLPSGSSSTQVPAAPDPTQLPWNS